MSAIKDQILKAIQSNALRSECSTDSVDSEHYARACNELAQALEHLRNAGVDLASSILEVQFAKAPDELAKAVTEAMTEGSFRTYKDSHGHRHVVCDIHSPESADGKADGGEIRPKTGQFWRPKGFVAGVVEFDRVHVIGRGWNNNIYFEDERGDVDELTLAAFLYRYKYDPEIKDFSDAIV